MSIPVNSDEHNKLAEQYLEHFSLKNEKYKKYDNFSNENSNSKVAVIVEPRKHKLLENIIRNVCYFLNQHPNLEEKNKWNIIVFHGVNNHEFLKNLLPNFNVRYINMNVDNITADEHNLLLQQLFFWKNIGEQYENVLIFQTDSCLMCRLDDKFLKYDFIGANILNPHAKTPRGFGMNGGLSLRNRNSMIKCLELVNIDILNAYRKKNNKNEFNIIKVMAEDIFFWHSLEILDKPLPPKNILPEFSMETILDFEYDYNNLKPCGIHGFNKNLLPINIITHLFSIAETP
jgi:hypothetical protein